MKNVVFVSGQYGGMRAAMTLRCFLSEIGCISVPNIFGIPAVQNALDADGKPTNEHMVPGAKQLITQLDWYAHSMAIHRTAFGLPK